MTAAEEGETLIVRHLPIELTPTEQEDLLKHFGANSVRTMGNKGRMKHIAFATFPDKDLARSALGKLHQLEILGTKLVVEFSTSQMGKFHPMQSDNYTKVKNTGHNESTKKTKPVIRKDEIDMQKVSENVNSLSREWGVQYPMDPRLEYVYPVPTVSILTNIANALASVPRFYVQVLHLMNKMNLPAPFGTITQTPVLPEGESQVTTPGHLTTNTSATHKENSQVLKNNINRSNVTINAGDSSEESEIESDGETQPSDARSNMSAKRPKKSDHKPRKRQKLIQVIPQLSKPTPVAKPSEVFEQTDEVGPKKIAFHLPRLEKGSDTQKHIDPPAQEISGHPPPVHNVNPVSSELVLNPPEIPSQSSVSDDPTEVQTLANEPEQHVESMEVGDGNTNHATSEVNGESLVQDPPLPPPLPLVVEGGFGKLEPVVNESESEDSSEEDETWGDSEFISSSVLRKGRISSSEMRDLSVFKKYDRGEPSTRLYVKNVAKSVTEKDLHYVYGRYVDWNNQEHCNMFDIRLMKEGRMKGQAFITLPTIKLAKDACKDTNGYNLQNKPIVVQFARSAKAKPEDQIAKKGKAK